jgi:hypothetical protein
MIKNGKNIKCKVCRKEFYISGSRFGWKKYCSKECAKQDNYGFKPKKKKCIICGKEFDILTGIETQKKTCSQKCWYENAKNISRKHSIIKSEFTCRICGKKYIGLTKYKSRTGKCKDCIIAESKKKRLGKRNPNYKAGLYTNRQRTSRQAQKHLNACARYHKYFLKKNGYKFCEVCGVNQNGTMQFQVHHLYTASRKPNHKELHNFKNLILLCLECHQKFHAYKLKEKFAELEKERGLKLLFKKS